MKKIWLLLHLGKNILKNPETRYWDFHNAKHNHDQPNRRIPFASCWSFRPLNLLNISFFPKALPRDNTDRPFRPLISFNSEINPSKFNFLLLPFYLALIPTLQSSPFPLSIPHHTFPPLDNFIGLFFTYPKYFPIQGIIHKFINIPLGDGCIVFILHP